MDEGGFNQVVNAGFKIGFLLMVVGIIVYLNEMMKDTVVEMFNLLEIWEFVNLMPTHLRIILAGIGVVLAAMLVGFMKDKLVDLVDGLFGRDKPFSV